MLTPESVTFDVDVACKELRQLAVPLGPKWYVMNPLHPLSRIWKPLGRIGIDNDEDEYLAIAELADWLMIAASKTAEVDEFGASEMLARDLLRGLILHVRYISRPHRAELGDVYDRCADLPNVWRQLPHTRVYAHGELMHDLRRYDSLSPDQRQFVNCAVVRALKPWSRPRFLAPAN